MSNGNDGDQSNLNKSALNRRNMLLAGTTLAAASALGTAASVQKAVAQAQQAAPAGQKPNILVIMGDDVGWFNIGAYHQGIMSGKTPNLDKLAADGMRFTDYYAEASCTAGRANFITGQIPLRTGLTTVGQAGADVGMPEQSVTTALLLKSMGYATGQFGKNHLGDLNKYLPTVHGFDEFFGYLYHLDAMSDPYWYSYPQDWIDKYGPRNLVHSYATDVDDPTVMPRWGKVGKQRIVDEGPLKPFKDMTADHQMWQKGRDAKYDMETFDEVLVEQTKGFMDRAKQANKPFFIWHNTTRMHVFTYLSQKYQAKMDPKSNFGLEEAGMAQMDDDIGDLLKHLDDIGVTDNTIVIFTTDNGAEVFTWPDGKHYTLNGEKMWITNAGFADLFTVFAKIGDKFSAFLVERSFPGFSVGAEEHKLGIRGSSTCPVILNDCKVPVENVLGEIGKGHIIAFNILNVGRFKLGAMCVGGARVSLENATSYAKQRKAFNKVIADFGLVREKLANMATLIYVGESLIYRTVGMMDVALSEVDKSAADAAKANPQGHRGIRRRVLHHQGLGLGDDRLRGR